MPLVSCLAFVAAAAGASAQVPPSTTTTTPVDTSGRPIPSNTPPLLYTPPFPKLEPPETLKDGRNSEGVIVGTSDALNDVPLIGSKYDAALAAVNSIKARIADATSRQDDANSRIVHSTSERETIAQLTMRNALELNRMTDRKDKVAAGLKQLAIQRYVTGIDSVYPDPNQTIEEAISRLRMRTLSASASRTGLEDLGRMTFFIAQLEFNRDHYAQEAQRNTDELSQAQQDLTSATNDRTQAERELGPANIELANSRANTIVANSDLPFVALDAYWRAANRLKAEDPACGLQWWGLAGIGRTESNHGRHSGGMPGVDGRVTALIIGNALDGTGGFQNIKDSDGGRLDGDGTFDRAIGPMQFIPTTWKAFAKDMTGDGFADPQNIYDGAYSSANYLCHSAKGLDTEEGLRRGYFIYNNSQQYVSEVLARSLTYRQLPVPPN